MNKKDLIRDLKKHLMFKGKYSHFDKFPTLFLDNFESYLQDNIIREWLRFYSSLTIEQIMAILFNVGNEQRPQKTLLDINKINKNDKKKFDLILINAFYGEMEDGPLVSILLGFKPPFCSNWLHRFYLIDRFIKGEWKITNEAPDSYGKLKEGNKVVKFKDKSINDLKREYPKSVDNFLNLPVQCKINVYYSDDLKLNLFNKSEHFQHGNDNVSDIQRLHAIESKNIEFIKKYFGGWRYQELIQEADGSVRVGDTFSYKDIRKQSIFPFVNERQLINITQTGGYIKGKRNRDRGYIYPAAKWNKLDLFYMGCMMTYQYENFVNGNLVYNIDLMDDIQPLMMMNEFSFKIEDAQKDFHNFYRFYLRLQDTQVLDNEITTVEKLFTTSKERISNHFFIWLYLKKYGKFHYDSKGYVDGKFVKAYTLLVDYFQTITNSMLNTDPLDFNSHRSSAKNVEGQQKQINAFLTLLFETTHEFTLEDGSEVELSLDKDEYLNWGFRYKDPLVRISNSIKTKARRKFAGCYITGHSIPKPNQDAHHIIYHDNGGPTILENIWMIEDKINRGGLNTYDSTSEYIEYQINNNPDIFTSERLDFWNNGELDKLKEYENDVNNYYWPSV